MNTLQDALRQAATAGLDRLDAQMLLLQRWAVRHTTAPG